jgi:saccharopine dehydrogenase-like NADP-dependent oxidoreductase
MTRIVLFGATGYTGRLTAEAMVARGERPVLAGRNSKRLAELAGRLGGLETAVADVAQPRTVRALVEAGDVLATTVGPFARWGDTAVEAAIDARAAYLDCNGEPSFIRRVFERYGQRAADTGTALVTAFGYDSVLGSLAAALALHEAGEAAERVDVGYFMPGDRRGWMSGGTRASLAAASLEPAFAWRAGIRTERPAARVRSFQVAGRRRRAISAGSSEHFALQRLHPQLQEVNTYLGYLVRTPRAVQLLSALGARAGRVPGVRAGVQTLAGWFVKGGRMAPMQGPELRRALTPSR